jgi:hypothetical protein
MMIPSTNVDEKAIHLIEHTVLGKGLYNAGDGGMLQ